MWSSNAALGALLVVACVPAAAVEDLRALEVQGQRGQSLEQARRDRYECHNWAVEQTGEAPAAVPTDTQPTRRRARATPRASRPRNRRRGDRRSHRQHPRQRSTAAFERPRARGCGRGGRDRRSDGGQRATRCRRSQGRRAQRLLTCVDRVPRRSRVLRRVADSGRPHGTPLTRSATSARGPSACSSAASIVE